MGTYMRITSMFLGNLDSRSGVLVQSSPNQLALCVCVCVCVWVFTFSFSDIRQSNTKPNCNRVAKRFEHGSGPARVARPTNMSPISWFIPWFDRKSRRSAEKGNPIYSRRRRYFSLSLSLFLSVRAWRRERRKERHGHVSKQSISATRSARPLDGFPYN